MIRNNRCPNIVLINPRRRYSRFNMWRYINPVIPPIGLAVLAAALEGAGISVSVIDAHAEQLDDKQILSRIGQATIFGITATTPEIDEAKRLSVLLMSKVSGAQVIMGGVHPTVEHYNLVSEGWCHCVVRGEGEIPIVMIAQGVPWDKIQNLTWMDKSGTVIVNDASTQKVDVETSPFPAYHLLPMDRYRPALGAAKRSPSMGIITSRGCPGGCNFCVSGSSPEKTRYMSAERVIEHIKFLQTNYGTREILFYDDTFTGSRKRVEKLCNLIIEQKIDVSWVCFARVDTVSLELLLLLKRAGCHQISYGIESPDPETLALMNKRISVSKVEQAVAWAKEAGIDVRGAFMLGSPGETPEHMNNTVEYAIRLDVDYAMFNITTPFPGTKLYDQAVENNWLNHENWSLYDLSHPIMKFQSASAENIRKAYSKAYARFYLRPYYFAKRFLDLFKRVPDTLDLTVLKSPARSNNYGQ